MRKLEIALEQTIENSNLAWQAKTEDEMKSYRKKADKIIVKGVNVRKKHIKARKQGDESGIIAVECSIPAAKVNVVCSKCGKATKVGYSEEKGVKVRVCKKCGAKLK